MKIDPITLEVLRNKFDMIAEEMELTLLKASYSSIVREGLDASAALFDTDGETIAQATAIPAHLGMLIPGVKRIIRAFPPPTMREGDVYLMNDPYDGGTHLPDIIIIVPVRHRGETVALACTMTHHQDVGGKSPGSTPTDATEIFQEGLRLPPLKLFDEGRQNETLMAILEKNIRIPEIVLGDLRAQIAAGMVGRNRLLPLFEEHGAEGLLRYKRELFDRAEVMVRAKLREIPDGQYRFVDYLDNDGVDLDRRVRIAATVTIRGDELDVDFTGTDPQVRGPINAVPSATLSAVYFVVKAITDPDIPNNGGCYRPVKVTLPPGTLVNPLPPAAVNARTATIKRICDVLLGALVPALPHRIPAAPGGELLVMNIGGIDPLNNQPYVTSELGAGGMGARPGKDGIDCIETDVTNCMNIPTEAIEMDYPIRIWRARFRADSGGAGTFRGGLGLDKVFEVIRGEAVFSHRGERHFTAPWGLFGGLPGQRAMATIHRTDGREEPVASKATVALRAGERLHIALAGGAGHGDPLERPAERVLEDVLDGRVTESAARDLYGVVLGPGGRTVEREATEALRSERRAARGPVTWTYDRGDRGQERDPP